MLLMTISYRLFLKISMQTEVQAQNHKDEACSLNKAAESKRHSLQTPFLD